MSAYKDLEVNVACENHGGTKIKTQNITNEDQCEEDELKGNGIQQQLN